MVVLDHPFDVEQGRLHEGAGQHQTPLRTQVVPRLFHPQPSRQLGFPGKKRGGVVAVIILTQKRDQLGVDVNLTEEVQAVHRFNRKRRTFAVGFGRGQAGVIGMVVGLAFAGRGFEGQGVVLPFEATAGKQVVRSFQGA